MRRMTPKSQQQREALEKASEQLKWLDDLLANKDFQRFTEEVLMRAVEVNRNGVLNENLALDDREKHLHRHSLAVALATWAPAQQEGCRQMLLAAQENAAPATAL